MARTSDPQAWLRPFYARLQQHPAFRHFAPSHRFSQLVQTVETGRPDKAAQREWSAAAQHASLLQLASMVEQNAEAEPVELWRVKKAERELRCVAHYLPTGIDIRLMEGEGFRRTQLVTNAPATEALSQRWRTALTDSGWTEEQKRFN